MIRKIYLSVFCLQIVLLLSNMQLCAQAPQLVNYQALLTDQTTGLPVADGEYTVTFSIYDMATGGIPLWAETQTVQITNGVYSVILGNVNPVDAALFSGSERYLGITVGADPEMTPRKQIVSVPYALHANTAESITGTISETDPVFSASQAAAITADDITHLGNLSGMNTGDQNLSIDGHLLTLSGGNTVQIPDSANDADADPVNEIQTLSLVGDLLSLSKDGGSVQLPACATGGAYYYIDKDGDGFGYMYGFTWVPEGVDPPESYVINSSDCNDDDYYTQDGSAEICDGIDNDCNGLVDEYWPELGDYCTSGDGQCLEGGFYICDENDPAGPAVCNAVPGVPAGSETCNYLDDDCDGDIDEDYRNQDGVYYTDNHCGNCGFDCSVIYNFPNAHGECVTDGLTATCEMRCDAGYYDLDGIPQNGCEFHLEENAIYVSPDGEDNAGCGTSVENGGACRTIKYGLTRAVSLVKQQVLVANGIYYETVNVQEGIDLLGGFNSITWNRNISASGTIIHGTDTIDGHPVTIVADGVNQAELSGFVIYGKDATVTGHNTYTVYLKNAGSELSLHDNIIYGGIAADGYNGLDGSDGVYGNAGNEGNNTVESNSINYFFEVYGGDGGLNTAGGNAGGNGAGILGYVIDNNEQASGEDGGATEVLGGSGGQGGHNRYTTNCGTFYTGGFEATGLPGADGFRGQDGIGGTGADDETGTVSGVHWMGANGSDGSNGGHGSGGGGGGCGGGADVSYDCSGTDDCSGGTGGGGGSGAEGGYAGSGGYSGGSSFCVFIVNGTSPAISDNVFYLGRAGNGGNGGFAGTGGTGGDGGLGGQVSGHWSYAMGNGGKGGKGGDGGHGGGGGGGAGGCAFGIYTFSASGTPDYQSTNNFTGGTAGTGGIGGRSYANPGGDGTVGIVENCSYH